MNILSVINILLLIDLLLYPMLLSYNKKYARGKNKKLNQFIKFGRKIHPYIGLLLIITGSIHGFLKLGGQFIFHTGSLLLILLILNGLLGLIYKRSRKRSLAKLHRFIGLLILFAFALHYLRPWLFSGF